MKSTATSEDILKSIDYFVEKLWSNNLENEAEVLGLNAKQSVARQERLEHYRQEVKKFNNQYFLAKTEDEILEELDDHDDSWEIFCNNHRISYLERKTLLAIAKENIMNDIETGGKISNKETNSEVEALAKAEWKKAVLLMAAEKVEGNAKNGK